MNQPRFRPRVVRPRVAREFQVGETSAQGNPVVSDVDFAQWQQSQRAEAAQQAAIANAADAARRRATPVTASMAGMYNDTLGNIAQLTQEERFGTAEEQARSRAEHDRNAASGLYRDAHVSAPRIAAPRRGPVSQEEFFGGQPVVQLDPVLAGRSQAALAQAMAENRVASPQRLPDNAGFSTEQLRAQGISDAELVQLGRVPGPSDATADELHAAGYGEEYIASHASDIRTPAQVRTAAGEIRRLSAMTPALPDGIPHQRPAPVVRRGAMDVPSMPSTAPSLDEVYSVHDGTLFTRVPPAASPASSSDAMYGPATQSDLSPQDYAAMRSQGPAMTQGPNMSSDPSLYRSMPQGQGAAPEDNATMPVPVYDGGEVTIEAGMYPADENGFPLAPGATVEIGAPQNIRSLAPRVGVPRRRPAPYVAGLPNAPGGTAEMPSALAPNGVDALMNGSGMRTPQRSPLDTQRDTLALNVRYAQQRAQDAQAAGEGIADVEIARQRRLEQNEMDRQRAEGIARQNVQRAADRAAAIRIDPSRAMQGASGIANVIAVVLGGIGSGITGGPNQPLAMVQQNIERDLAAQRTDLDTARNAVADQQSILGNIRQEFQSREAADHIFRANALAQAAAQVEIQAQRTNGAEAGDRAANLREQLENQRAQELRAAEVAEMERLLAFDQSRSVTGLNDARARATLATASGTEAANARRALMASRGRAPYGSWEEWQRLTPAQQATRMQNAQDAQLTGTPLADAMVLSGVPSGGLQGERVPVENGARAGAGGAPEQLDAMELGRRLTNANTMMQSGVDAATANARANLPPGTLERQAVAPEQTLRLAAADNALRTLEGAIARAQVDGNGIAGVGLIDNNLPGMVSSDEALQNRIAIAGAIDSFIRVSSGANAPESEVQRQRDMVIGDGTERALIAGVQYLRGQLDAQLGNTASIGTDVEAQDSLAAQLGVAPRVDAPAPEPAPGTPTRPRVPLLRARSSGSGRNLE